MARLSGPPTGVVTFLFTDIEGSTRMWDEVPEAMTGAMARHDELLDSIIERHSGLVFKHTGDGICAAFQSPTDALDASIAIQEAFGREVFESLGHILVRVVLHTGEAEELGGDYRGPALNRVARLLDVAVGGDILLSDTAEEMVRATLPRDIELGDLGEHHLRGIRSPGRVYFVEKPAGRTSDRKRRRWVAAIGAVVLVAGAVTVFSLANPPGTATPESTVAINPPSTTATTSAPDQPEPDHTPKWEVRPGGDISGVVASGGIVLIGSRTTGLHAFRVENAEAAWPDGGLVVDLDRPLIEPFGAPLTGAPVVGSGRVYYSTLLGTLHAVDLNTGSLLWTHRFERCREDGCVPLVPSSPVVVGEAVVVAAGSDLYRFVGATGTYDQVPGGFGAATAGPSIGGDFVYVAEGTSVYQIPSGDLGAGQSIFLGEDVPVGYRAEVTSLLTPSMPSDFGLGSDHGLFIVDGQGFLTRRSPSTGSVHPAWTDPSGAATHVEVGTPPAVGPSFGEGDVPVIWSVDPSGILIATDAAGGQRLAAHRVGPTSQPVAVGSDGFVYVVTDFAELVVYDPVEAAEVYRQTLAARPASGPVVSGEQVFVAGVDGAVRGYAAGGAVSVDQPASTSALDGPVTDVAWSSTGDLAFVHDGDVWVLREGELLNVTDSAGGGWSPDWSPDGSRLAYVSGSPGRDIYVIGADGTGRRNLTETRNADELEPDWSPDGSRIVFSTQACADQGGPQPERVCSGLSTLSTVDTSGRRQPLIDNPAVIASDREPDWSPSGDLIVFSSDRPVAGRPLGAGRSLFTVGLEGADPVPLPGGDIPGAHDPAYSPDGTLVAFEAGGGPGGTAAVYVVDIAAGAPALPVELPVGAGAPAWSPDGTRVAFAWELSALGRIYTVSVVP